MNELRGFANFFRRCILALLEQTADNLVGSISGGKGFLD